MGIEGRSHSGAERQEIRQALAQPLVKAGLHVLGWTQKALSERAKGGKGKVKIARQLRAETTMTLRWIADRLHMGSWTCLTK